ncbi:MAG TPA: 30S ribosomal protein S20 [Clostridia bacterium]|nr:30S ribosomal protein S20 [Clostridia bacterium]
MANHKSALKRVGTTAKKNLRNRMVASQVKTAVKSFDTVVASGDKAAADKAFVQTVSTVDKAAAKGVIHKNAANRKKAQLAKKLTAKAQ